jgi:glycosyltransferase involved in cell wall biosynthesis
MNFLSLKKKIKFNLEQFIPFKIKIENKIKKRRLERAIFIFNITDYNYRLQRPQFLAKEFAKKIAVFFVNPSFLPEKRVIGDDLYKADKIDNNLYLINLLSDRNYFIYFEEISKKGKEIIVKSLKNLLCDFAIKKYVMIINHPGWYFILDYFDNKKIIYDCLDDHTIFKENRRDINNLEEKIVGQLDNIVVTSAVLAEKIKRQNKTPIVISNGISDLLIEEGKKVSKSDFTKKKDFLYIGEINWWFDEQFLQLAAERFPQHQFHLIGRVHNRKIFSLAKKYKNLKIYGELPYSQLVNHLKAAKVGLIPFKVTKEMQAVNPIKLYEYFAFGMPVVASSLREIQVYRDLVYLYRSKEEIKKNLESALAESNQSQTSKRMKVASANTWEKKAKEYFKIMDKLL